MELSQSIVSEMIPGKGIVSSDTGFYNTDYTSDKFEKSLNTE